MATLAALLANAAFAADGDIKTLKAELFEIRDSVGIKMIRIEAGSFEPDVLAIVEGIADGWTSTRRGRPAASKCPPNSVSGRALTGAESNGSEQDKNKR